VTRNDLILHRPIRNVRSAMSDLQCAIGNDFICTACSITVRLDIERESRPTPPWPDGRHDDTHNSDTRRRNAVAQ
jgi:hypothetical protein